MNKNTNFTGLEIAVIGMAGRFPGSKNIDEFWANLVKGKESISFFTDEELLEAGVTAEILANPNYIKANGFLEGSAYFDAAFFGYSGGEAAFMDPQVRIFHECAWSGLEDAGYYPGSYHGIIGLFAGASFHHEWLALCLLSDEIAGLGSFSAGHLLNKDFLCGWVSYKLDLKGPTYNLTTACSTSLVAVHEACQSILNGECDMALAGGVCITNINKSGYMYIEGMMYSSDGHVRAFDVGPHGIIGGNGAAVVLLKRYEDAVKDRDHIYALIKGSAINNDGLTKAGFAAPSIEGQARVIRAAMAMAEVAPETIGYIETHGTATELGDPVEIQGLKLAFNTGERQYCRIGSVKTNIGHLDTAAGAAGLIKAALCVYHGVIPPSLNFKHPNPNIDFANSPFYVNAELSTWKSKNTPRRAGVSSFGIGGTNAHVILEEAPELESTSPSRAFQLLLLSAKTGAALDRNAENLALYLEKNPGINLADAAYTLQTGRQSMPYRRMAVCPDREQAVRELSLAGQEGPQFRIINDDRPSPVFMFPGQGSQYVNMGLDLYKEERPFREEMDHGFHILASLCHTDIKDILYPSPSSQPGAEQKINDIRYSGPIKLLCEYALAKLLIKWGLIPHAMIGHSFGEYTAACLAGVFSLEDALKLSVLRGQLMAKMPAGAVISVPIPEKELIPLLSSELAIAAVNAPALCLVSGPTPCIERFEGELAARGHGHLRLNVPVAFHSPMMLPYKDEFSEFFTGIRFSKPQIPYISGITGDWITGETAASPLYWGRHMVETIRFTDGISRLINEMSPVFVQVGPDPGLPLFVKQNPHLREENLVVNMIRRKKDNKNDLDYLLGSIGQLWMSGVNIDWKGFYAQEKRNRIALPAYSFERISYLPPIGDLNKISAHLMTEKPPAIPASFSAEGQDGQAVAHFPPRSGQYKQKRPKLKTEYAPPTDELEQKFVEIFQAFFEIEPLGIHDDFFELGGDSLKAVQLVGLLKKSITGFTLSIQQLLYYQNIHDICRSLRAEEKKGSAEIKNGPSAGSAEKELPLKDEISPGEGVLIKEELKKINQLSGLLKMNVVGREYEVSPIQAFSLTPPYGGVKKDIILFYTDYHYPIEREALRERLAAVIQRHALLRSVVIEREGKHFIREYRSFTNFYLPFLDLSTYSVSCREKIAAEVISYLYQPMEVLDHVLFRPVLVKMTPSHWRLVILSNHLITDGSSGGILDKQLQASHLEIDNTGKTNSAADYYDYVQFMKTQNYDHIDLNKFINLSHYSCSIEKILPIFKMAEVKCESFKVNISIIPEKFKAYYHEITLWVYARLISDLYRVDHVPIGYVTNGRVYKDGNFNHIIGDFHDIIPVLISLTEDPGLIIERFIDYKRFIKENNLNFMNYMGKYTGRIPGLAVQELHSPFSFNALIWHTNATEESIEKRRTEVLTFTSPYVGMLLQENFSADEIGVTFTQNTEFSLTEKYLENYFSLVDYLNKKR